MKTRLRELVPLALAAMIGGACGVDSPQLPDDPTVSGSRCQSKGSVNWKATVGANLYVNPDSADVLLPAELGTCTVHFGTDEVPHQVNSYVWFRFNLHGNKVNGTTPHGAESGTYSFSTMNTAATEGGAALGKVTQINKANWVVVRQQYWVNTSGGDVLYEDMQLPLQVTLGYPREAGKLERDSLHLQYWSRVTRSDPDFPDDSGVYVAATDVILDDTIPGAVGGLSAGTVGVEQGWQFVPSTDSMGYRYTWYVNNVPQTTWKGFYMLWYTPTVAGTHTIRLDQKLVDTTYVLTKVITVPIPTGISGPVTVNPWVTNSYSALVSNGTAPYSYHWTVDGNYYSSNSSITTPAWNQLTEHTITLTVTDANSATGYADMQVFTSGGECDINDPNCHIEERLPQTSARKASAIPRKPANARLWELLRKP